MLHTCLLSLLLEGNHRAEFPAVILKTGIYLYLIPSAANRPCSYSYNLHRYYSIASAVALYRHAILSAVLNYPQFVLLNLQQSWILVAGSTTCNQNYKPATSRKIGCIEGSFNIRQVNWHWP